jgi:hypothetical protein
MRSKDVGFGPVQEGRYWFIEMGSVRNSSLWGDVAHELSFMKRTDVIAKRWGVDILCFRLMLSRVTFVVWGDEKSVRHWQRLSMSGHGVQFFHQGGFMCWEPPVVLPLRGEEHALEMCDGIHKLGRHPLMAPWSSLRDICGLREAPWFSPKWLLDQRSVNGHMDAVECDFDRVSRALKGPNILRVRLKNPVSWREVGSAVEQITGRPSNARSNRRFRMRLAWLCGWDCVEIARALRIGRASVNRALRSRLYDPLSVGSAFFRLDELREGLSMVDVVVDSW